MAEEKKQESPELGCISSMLPHGQARFVLLPPPVLNSSARLDDGGSSPEFGSIPPILPSGVESPEFGSIPPILPSGVESPELGRIPSKLSLWS